MIIETRVSLIILVLLNTLIEAIEKQRSKIRVRPQRNIMERRRKIFVSGRANGILRINRVLTP